MSSPSPNNQANRFQRYYLYLRFFRDTLFSLADIFAQCTVIHPWYLIFPVLALKLVAFVGYAFGSNMDHYIPKGVEGLVVIRGPRGCYLFEGDKDEVEREKRMGVLGQSAANIDQGQPNGTAASESSQPRKIMIAAVCPVYLCDPDKDPKALQRVHQSLYKQTRRPDLVVFVDDDSPMLQTTATTSHFSAKPRLSISNILHCVIPVQSARCPDPYEQLEYGLETYVLRPTETRGPAAARNQGIDHAIAVLGNNPGNTVIFLLDMDCVAPPDWIENGYTAVSTRRPGLLDDSSPVSPMEPLLVGGLTCGANPSSFYSYYHELFGTLNPRIIRLPNPNTRQFKPLYASTCNMVVFPGDVHSEKKLPRFHEGFREAAQEDVLFCLEAVYGRGCELVFDRVSRSTPMHGCIAGN